MNLAFRAMQFAKEVHKDHKRKYTGQPYTDHLAEVAGIVATVQNDLESIATAWLHDCVEDCGVPIKEIYWEFGMLVGEGVSLLSDLETGNRVERKTASRARLSHPSTPAWVQTIKCADLISNTQSIVQHDPKFAVIYLEEKRLLLDVLDRANPLLRNLAYSLARQKLPEAV